MIEYNQLHGHTGNLEAGRTYRYGRCQDVQAEILESESRTQTGNTSKKDGEQAGQKGQT
jgi:hypothetical protein